MSDDTTHMREQLAALTLEVQTNDGLIDALESRLRQAERERTKAEAERDALREACHNAMLATDDGSMTTERLCEMIRVMGDAHHDCALDLAAIINLLDGHDTHIRSRRVKDAKAKIDALAARLAPPDDGALRELCEAWETYTSHGAWTTEANVALMTFLLACRRLDLPALVARARRAEEVERELEIERAKFRGTVAAIPTIVAWVKGGRDE